MWSSRVNPRGKIIENLIKSKGLLLLNDNKPSFQGYHCATTIDLFLASPSIALNFSSYTLSDTYGSDHYPVIAEYDGLLLQNSRRVTFRTDRADWEKFSNIINLSNINRSNIDSWVNSFRKILVSAAQQSIPQTKACTGKKRLPFWNDELREKVMERKRTLREFRRTYRLELHNKISKLTNEIRKDIRIAKSDSWDKFVTGIDTKTNGHKIWRRVNAISKGTKETSIQLLQSNNKWINDPKEIVDCLAENFANLTYDSNTESTRHKKKILEDSLPDMTDDYENESYNRPISRIELEVALQSAKGKSPGEDKITYDMLAHLPNHAIKELIDIYNYILDSGKYPIAWKRALVIPIPKLGLNQNTPNGLRPISLLTVLARILERILNLRLQCELERKGLISRNQTAFRKRHSAMDSVAFFANSISQGFARGDTTVAVFVDLKSAFDSVWKPHIVKELYQMGIKGKLLRVLSGFLSQRSLTVVNGNSKSLPKHLTNGVPQGSALSCTLFLVAVNKIISKCRDVKVTMYADDLTVWLTMKNEKELNIVMQNELNKILSDLEQVGFTISKEKTCFMAFSTKRNPYEIKLKLISNGLESQLNQVDCYKLLGIQIDSKCSFQEHIYDLVQRLEKNNRALRVIGGSRIGGNRKTLLMINKAINLSIINYGRTIYSQANQTNLAKIDSAYRKAIKICLGAFCTTPTVGLLEEASELPLNLITDLALIKYALNVLSNHEHILYTALTMAIEHPDVNFTHKLGRSQPLVQRLTAALQRLGLSNLRIMSPRMPFLLPQELKSIIQADTILHSHLKNSLGNLTWKKLIHDRLSMYKSHRVIYTDGSKSSSSVGAAWSCGSNFSSFLLHENYSVFSAELYAIFEGLKSNARQNDKVLVCTDSLSSINAIVNSRNRHAIVWKIQNLIKARKCFVTLLWIPSHVGFPGNEEVDKLAKSPDRTNFIKDLPYSDIKAFIISDFWENFNKNWVEVAKESNKLRNVKGSVEPWEELNMLNRRESTIITRLRFGHTALTHAYLITKENRPLCSCNELLTVEHIFKCLNDNAVKTRKELSIKWPQCLELDELQNYKNVLKYLKKFNYHTKI